MGLKMGEILSLGLVLLVVLGAFALLSGPDKRTSFTDLADEFCTDLDSEVEYANPERKMVICE